MTKRTVALALAGLVLLPAGAAAHGPPQVTGGPTGTTNQTRAEFTISYEEPVLSQKFECKLDAADWEPCTDDSFPEGKAVYENLADGPHTFQARRVEGEMPDPSVDDTPSEPRTWTVDTAAPKTTIAAVPASGEATTATIEFSADDAAATFQCSVDGAAFGDCASPLALTDLTVGVHVVNVRASDAAGNVEDPPAQAAWSVLAPATPAPAAPAPGPVAAPVPPAPRGLPAGTKPLITVGKAVRRPKTSSCARKRSAKRRAACRRAAKRKARGRRQ